MKAIESLAEWLPLSAELSARGYKIYQSQYRASSPEGFHAWFWAEDRPDVEIVTHNNDVYRAIMKHK